MAHAPYGDRCVTVILEVTPIHDCSGPSRLLDMAPGRSKWVLKTWLASLPNAWRERIEIIAMDGFTGFKSEAVEEVPGVRVVMDPFHVVRLAGDAFDECCRRTGQELHHRRERAEIHCARASEPYATSHANSRRASNARYSTYSPVRSKLHSRLPRASTRASSMLADNPT